MTTQVVALAVMGRPFIAKLAALVPMHRVNLTRFHGVFAPNSKHRALVTPAKRGKDGKFRLAEGEGEKTPVQRHAAMTWAQRLKRVFNIDVEKCRVCGSTAKVMPKALAVLAGQALACIEDPVVIKKILAHLEEKSPPRACCRTVERRRSPACSADSQAP